MGWPDPLQHKFFACLCMAALLVACSPAEPPAGAAPDQTSGRIEAGADLFTEQCGACHGSAGRGPSLETLKALSSEDLRAGIRNHPTAGTIPQRLPAGQLSDLIDFLEQ